MKLELQGPDGKYLVLVTDCGHVNAKPQGDLDPYVHFVVMRHSSLSIFPDSTRKKLAHDGFKPGVELDAVVRALGYEARRRRPRRKR
jgi:hypothetical protein